MTSVDAIIGAMRTTVALDDDLVRIAQEFTGVAEKTALIREALKAPHRAGERPTISIPGGHNAEIEEYSSPQAGDELILADTSIWIDHLRSGNLRSGNKELRKHLNEGQIVIHPSIIAELALGSLQERTKTLALLDLLPQVRVAQLSEVRRMIEARRLYSLGIGLTDAHLIASVFINPSTLLWTRDKRLRKAAEGLGIHASLA